MSDQAYACLNLNSFEADSINASKSQMTFNQINFRFLLGDMYDKYDKFNIQLKTLITDQTSASMTIVNRNSLITLQGPQFLNANFNMSRKNNFGPAVAGALLLGTNAVPSFDSNSSNILTFLKPQISDITLTFVQVLDKAVSTGTFPNVSLVFQIWGVGEPRGPLEVVKRPRIA